MHTTYLSIYSVCYRSHHSIYLSICIPTYPSIQSAIVHTTLSIYLYAYLPINLSSLLSFTVQPIPVLGRVDLAAVFFKPQKGVGGRFDAAPYQLGELGLPLLNDALGALECELVGQVAHGDHTVFVGEVKSAVLHRDGAALELSSTGWQYGG